jgi:hypothetical protein
MLMSVGLSSKALSPMLIVGLVRMLAVVGVENSRRVLSAITLKTSVKLHLAWLSSYSKAETLLSLTLFLLNNACGSLM